MANVHVVRDFPAPIERTFAYFAEHDNLGVLFFPAKVSRVRDGASERNGVGSTRRLSFKGLLAFEETVIGYVPNERIEYTITKGTPIRDHHGVMAFSSIPGGSRLDYTIRLRSPAPGLAPLVALVLRQSIARGLDKAASSIR